MDSAIVAALNRLTLALIALTLMLIVINMTLEDIEVKLALVTFSLRRLAPPPARDGETITPSAASAGKPPAVGVEGSEAHA